MTGEDYDPAERFRRLMRDLTAGISGPDPWGFLALVAALGLMGGAVWLLLEVR